MAASSSWEPFRKSHEIHEPQDEPQEPGELTHHQHHWLNIDSDSEGDVLSAPSTVETGRKRAIGRAGRKRGDAEFQQRMQMLKSAAEEAENESQDDQIQIVHETPAQLRARAAREEKKRKADQRTQSATALIPANAGGIPEVMHRALTCFDEASDLHVVGTPLQKNIMTIAYSMQSKPKVEEEDEAIDLVRFFLQEPALASARSISKMLNTPRSKVQNVEALASATLLESNSWMTGAFFRGLHQRIIRDNPKFLPWVWLTSLRYDETPLKLRVREGDGACTQAKVVQVEFKWMCLLKANGATVSKQFQHLMLESDVLTYLKTVDHQTGETLLGVTSSIMNIPEIDRSLSWIVALFCSSFWQPGSFAFVSMCFQFART